jgi:hypothetical protein
MGRTKGSHVLQAVKALRYQRERALALLPPSLHKYLEQRILPSSWYPTEDHLGLLRALASLLPGSDPWLTMGRLNAQLDLNGLYRNRLRVGDPARTMQAFEAIWSSAYDSGKATVILSSASEGIMKLNDFDSDAPEICRIITGYLTEAATLSGARGVQVTHDECRNARGDECIWRVRWVPTAP